MGEVKLLQIKFTKEDLSCIPEEEAIFLLQFGGLIQDVISLQKFIHMSSHGVDNDIERMAENSQSMYFYRLLAGTLYEGWTLFKLKRYRTTIAKYKPMIDQQAKSNFNQLEKFFSKQDNWCKVIRDNFIYHYNYGKIRNMLNEWPGKAEFLLFLSDYHANCRYVASDMITNFAILGTSDLKEFDERLDSLIKKIPEVADSFIDLVSEYLAIILKNIVTTNNINSEDITLQNIPQLNELRLHYFIDE